MALYIRLQASFFSHRKTAKLQSLIGSDALWLVPKLWCYAAHNQPDGNFSAYSAEELALLLGYTSNATSMLQALLDARFLDADMRLHDWGEHNDYHATFTERARKAAHARWSPVEKKESSKEKRERVQDKTRQEQASTSNATSITLPFTSVNFSTSWTEWEQHRKEIRKPITPTARKSQLLSLKEMGEVRALAAIRHSISNGWQGIYEPDKKNGATPPTVIAKGSWLSMPDPRPDDDIAFSMEQGRKNRALRGEE